MQPLPLTPAEVLTQILASRQPRPKLDTPLVPPQNELEVVLADCWAEVLGLQEVGVNDNFFNLGGDSLHMTRISSRVHERCGVEVSFDKFFENPTIAGLARVVQPALEEDPAEMDTIAIRQEMVLSPSFNKQFLLPRLPTEGKPVAIKSIVIPTAGASGRTPSLFDRIAAKSNSIWA